MRNPVAKVGVVIALCALVAAIAMSAELRVSPTQGESKSITLLRSGASAGTFATAAACDAERLRRRALDAATYESGQIRYTCREDRAVTVYFGPNLVTPPPPPAGTAALSWNHDGLNTAGYRVHYGTSSTALTQTIQIAGPSVRAYTIANLSPGTYFFAVRAYSTGGESAPSNLVTKIVQ
jgi:hypothetical protein